MVKRHHFRGGAATHGSMFHRAPGSIGASAYPSRVLKGMRGAGHMGSERVTVRNLTVVRVDAEKNILVVKGAVPGRGRRATWSSARAQVRGAKPRRRSARMAERKKPAAEGEAPRPRPASRDAGARTSARVGRREAPREGAGRRPRRAAEPAARRRRREGAEGTVQVVNAENKRVRRLAPSGRRSSGSR